MWWLLFIAVFSVVFVKLKLAKRHRPPRELKLLEVPREYLPPAPEDPPAEISALHSNKLQAEDHTIELPPLVTYHHWEPAILFWGFSDRITWRLQKPSRARFGNKLRRLWRPIQAWLRRLWRPIRTRFGNKLRWYVLGVAVLLVGVGIWLWTRS